MNDERANMRVRVDGEIVWRPIAYLDRELARYEPQTKDNELVAWAMGDPVPTIIRSRA